MEAGTWQQKQALCSNHTAVDPGGQEGARETNDGKGIKELRSGGPESTVCARCARCRDGPVQASGGRRALKKTTRGGRVADVGYLR